MLGGSFDPVHNGHFFLADLVLATFGYDRIILVPAFQSPFKPGGQPQSASDRLEMLAAAMAGDPHLTCDDCEIRRTGVSYTIDTVHDLVNRYRPEGKLGLIIGDDLAAGFPDWKEAGTLADLTDIIMVHRTGTPEIAFPFPYKHLTHETLDLSSSIVRNRIQNGEQWHYLVPKAVRSIIEDRGLYGSTIFHNQLLTRVENAVRSMLNLNRFLHSRSTALLCYDLCVRFNLNPEAGYLAGIAHDMCKNFSDIELIRCASRDGLGFSKLEQEKPGLLHARVAAILLQEQYNIHDEAILEAVRFHTMGHPGMGALAKVLYSADKIEVSRSGVDPAVRDPTDSTLDSFFLRVLSSSVAYLQSKKVEISPDTLELLEAQYGTQTKN